MFDQTVKNYRVSFLMRGTDTKALIDLIRDDITELRVEEIKRSDAQPTNGMEHPRRARRGSATPSAQTIYNFMVPGKNYASSDFAAILEAHGYKASSASPTLGKLENDGLLVRISRSLWMRPVEPQE